MSNTIVAVDPQSGHDVRIAFLDRPQTCSMCGLQMQNTWGMSVLDDHGWTCLIHHVRRLMALPMSRTFKARAVARDRFRGILPGDTAVVDEDLLVALGLET